MLRLAAKILLPALVAAVLASSCASDGRELAEARPWQTTTTRPLPATSAPPAEPGLTGVELSSPDFEPGGLAPVDATCAGLNQPPTLRWSGVEAGTSELAMALSDQTDPANPLLIWLVAGLDPALTELRGDALPTGAISVLNDYGQAGYGNPCIDTLSSGRRDLQFRLYLLPNPSGLDEGAAGNSSWDHVAALASDSATLLMQIDSQP